jgi:NAD kinase
LKNTDALVGVCCGFEKCVPLNYFVSGSILEWKDHALVLHRIFEQEVELGYRERLICRVFRSHAGNVLKNDVKVQFQAMNEVSIHRSHTPQLARIECEVNNQSLTTVVVRTLPAWSLY